MSTLRILGGLLAVFGIVAAIMPDWFGPLTGGGDPAPDVFEAVERRVRAGMVLGVGLLLLAHTKLRPWSATIAAVVFYVVLGALAARFLGLAMDGTHSRQWLWAAVELVILVPAGAWLWRTRQAAQTP